MDESMSKVEETNRKIEGMQISIDKLALEQGSLQTWKPQLEGRVTSLQQSVDDLKLRMDLFIHELPSHEIKGESSLGTPAPAHLGAPVTTEVSGQNCHREAINHRSVGAGVVTTLVPPPVKGADRNAELTPVPFVGLDPVDSSSQLSHAKMNYSIPNLDFPKFDGSNPKIWIRRCENYFDVMNVSQSHWVKLAVMHFGGSAAFWMQSIEMDVKLLSWEHLCQAVVERFERDQHNHIIRQFFLITQSGFVAEYIELFDELVHQLLAHDPYFNPSVITNRFIDGLKPEIKAVVLVHRPKDLDTASSLAILQEEVLMGYPSKAYRRSDEIIGTKYLGNSGFQPPGVRASNSS
ncbi:unnamed protein product [Urochloa humidicola]